MTCPVRDADRGRDVAHELQALGVLAKGGGEAALEVVAVTLVADPGLAEFAYRESITYAQAACRVRQAADQVPGHLPQARRHDESDRGGAR